MKRYISCLLTLALFIPALVSCTRELQDDHSQNNTHLVYFYTSNPETRTGLTIDEGWVYPDWRETKEANLHFFEIPENGGDPTYGEALDIVESVDNTTARFVASFTEEMTIIADPSTRAGGSDMFYYGAVVAQMLDEDDFTFVIPAKQKPDAETLKDPDADFLIGYSRKACDVYVDDENVVDLYFDRVAALGRLSLSNFKGANEKVKSVTINSTAGLVGSATYADIHFGDKNTVDFTRTEGPLTLTYDTGEALTEGAFEAYFVVIPGEATITSIEVLTDQYKYTKTLEGGKPITFSNEKFKNINVDLENAVAEKVSSVWYKASVLEAGYPYMIVSANNAMLTDGSTLSVVPVTIKNDGTIEIEASEVTLWNAAEHIEYYDTGKPAGHFTLSIGSGNDVKYLERYSNQNTQNGQIVSTPTADSNGNYKYYVWDYDGEHLYQISRDDSNGIYYIYYNDSWKFEYQSSPNTYLYTTRAPQTLSFTPAGPFEYNLDDPTVDFQEPALSEHFGEVTYTSSDENKATVAADGNVTFLKAGQVTITATAAGDAEHQAASASYTINISSSQVLVYHKVSSTADLEVGAKYILVYEQTPSVFKPILESDGNSFQKAKANVIETEISAGTISSSDFEACHFTLEIGYYLKSDQTGKYLYPAVNSSNRGLLSAESTPSHQLTIAFADGIAMIQNGEYYLVWSSNSSNLYFSSGNSVSGSYYDGICLYKLDDGRQAQNPTFNPPGPFTIDKATQTFTAPELQDYHGDVTYMSDNESVATVNANTGAVEIVGRGEVVISATIKGDANYKSATASYELTVTDSSLQSKTYRKVTSTTELTVGSKYLIVYESSPSVFKPILESDGNSFQKAKANVMEAEILEGTITSPDFEACHFTLESGYYLKSDQVGKYIYPNQANSRGLLSAESTASHSLTISFDGGIAKINNGSYYIVWSSNSSNLYFSSGNSVSSSYYAGICLYKLDDGSVTPTEPQTLEFDGNTAEFDLIDGGRWVTEPPTLNEAGSVVRPIEWSSSATTVAEVDQNGNVTIPLATAKKGDTAIITATAPAGTVSGVNYSAASASYTITISDTTPQTTSTYVLIPSSMGVISGKNYLIVSADASNYNGADHKKAFAGDEAGTAGGVSASNGTITGNYSDYEFTITKSGSNYTLLGPNGYVTGNSSTSYSRYIQVSSSEVTMSLAMAADLSDALVSDAFYFYYTKTSGSSTSKETLYLNSDGKYKIGGTGRKYGVYLYMKYNGEQLAQNLSFSKDAASYNMASSASFTAPTLSGAMTTVTYSSSKPGVATVDASTGAVSFVGVGETTITATAVADTYNGINYGTASASYTLTVKNSTQLSQTYTKVDALTSGATYLIVSHTDDLVFKGDGTTNGPSTSVTPDNGVITASSDDFFKEYEVVITEQSSGQYSIYFTNLGKYLYYASSDSGLAWETTYSSSHYFSLSTVSSGDYQGSFLFNRSSRYLYHNGTQFKIGGSGSAKGVHLYKKEANP